MIVVYKIKDNKIIEIARKADDYQLQANEYSSDTWFLKPSFTGSAVVESITQQEIDDRLDAETEQAALAEADQREQDGRALIRDIRGRMRRKFNDGMSLSNYKQIRSAILNALLPLKDGYWDDAKENIDAVPTQTGQKEVIRVWIKSKIDDYVTNNY